MKVGGDAESGVVVTVRVVGVVLVSISRPKKQKSVLLHESREKLKLV